MTRAEGRATVRYMSYPIEGEPDDVRSQVEALRRNGELARLSGRPTVVLPDGRLRVEVVVYARASAQASTRRVYRPLVAVAVSFPAAGVAGWVAGVQGAELIAQAVAALGVLGALALLVYALATVRHRRPGHHCPGCQSH